MDPRHVLATVAHRAAEAEAHQEAEGLIYNAAKLVNELTGLMAELVISAGRPDECLKALLDADKDISILVLAASTAKEGPGPLVSMFARPGAYPIPVTIVPGSLSDDIVDDMA